MATNFPTSVDNFTNPTANDSLNLPSHSTQHANANDAIEAIEGYLLNGGQGLTLVKKQTIGTSVSSVQVTNAFNSTYESYKIIISGGAAVTTGQIDFKLGSTTTGYYSSFQYITYAGSSSAIGTNNGALFPYMGYEYSSALGMNLDIINPFLSKVTMVNSPYYGNIGSGHSAGYLNNTTSYTDFTAVFSSPATGGTIYVYGYGLGQ